MHRFSIAVAVSLSVLLALAVASPTAALADAAADVEAVERELEAEETAMELFRRAVERANEAVETSSLGKRVKQLAKELAAIEEAFVNTQAYREWRGPDKFVALCLECESQIEGIGTYAEHTERMNRYFDARRSFRVDEVLEEYDTARSRMNALRNRMVLKFLADEIARAVEQGLDGLERELRQLEKKAQKGLTI